MRSLHVAGGLPESSNPLNDSSSFILSDLKAVSEPNVKDNIDFSERKHFRPGSEHSHVSEIVPNALQPITSTNVLISKLRSITKCTMCDFNGTAHALNMHYKVMHKNPNQCNEPISLIYRKGKRRYNCTLCLYDVPTRAAFLQHAISDHLQTINQLTGVNYFDCDICTKVFSSFTDFEAHQNKHIFRFGLRQFFCDYCGLCVRSKCSLTKHMAICIFHKKKGIFANRAAS